MASYGYGLSNYTSGSTTSVDKSYSVDARSSIPDYAAITSVSLYFEWKTSLSSKGDLEVYYGSTKIGGKWQTGKDWQGQTITLTPSNFNSGNANVGLANENITFKFSATIWRKFSIQNAKVTFNYTEASYTISTAVSPSGSGSVSGGGSGNYGSTKTLTATPASGYRFVKWSDNNTSNPRTVTITGNATYTAVFERDTVRVTNSTDCNVAYALTSDPNNYIAIDDYADLSAGSEIFLFCYSKSKNGILYTPTQWTGDMTSYGTNFYIQSLVVNSDINLTVTTKREAKIIFNYNTDEVIVNGGVRQEEGIKYGLYEIGQDAEIEFVSKIGYIVTDIKLDGVSIGFSQFVRSFKITISNVQSTHTIDVTCQEKYCTISASVYPQGAGTITGTGSGVYKYDEYYELIAVPNTGYEFKYWLINGEPLHSTARQIGDATRDESFVAVFEQTFINDIYIGTSNDYDAYVGTEKVDEVYVGSTKIY